MVQAILWHALGVLVRYTNCRYFQYTRFGVQGVLGENGITLTPSLMIFFVLPEIETYPSSSIRPGTPVINHLSLVRTYI